MRCFLYGILSTFTAYISSLNSFVPNIKHFRINLKPFLYFVGFKSFIITFQTTNEDITELMRSIEIHQLFVFCFLYFLTFELESRISESMKTTINAQTIQNVFEHFGCVLHLLVLILRCIKIINRL